MLINESKMEEWVPKGSSRRWKAGIVFGDAMMRMDPMLVVKRPNSGTLFPPFILRIQISIEMTVRFGIGRKWC